MNKTQIQELLHHRDPYLMVSEVTKSNENEIESLKTFSGDEFFVKGHFPNAPVVPGAMIQEFCTQSAGVLITKYHSPVKDYNSNKTKGWALGVLNKVQGAKYLSIVKPQGDLKAKVKLIDKMDNLFKFSAEVYQDDELKAKLKFSLVNISDDYLTGE